MKIRGKQKQKNRLPVLSKRTALYEMSSRQRGILFGGIAGVHQVALQLGLAQEIDSSLKILKAHLPYHESDHVLNIAYSQLCMGRTLQDIELLRNDQAYLDALGARCVPDPTTAADFCRRFTPQLIQHLQDALNRVRARAWRLQPGCFFEQTARIDADGTIVQTGGECKEGIGLSYKGEWGYHPLLISLANTREPLFVVNRSGNQKSSEGAAHYLDRAIELCRSAGFKDILLRGDTDFSQTRYLDGWDQDGVRFVFGFDARKNLKGIANGLDDSEYTTLEREAEQHLGTSRARQPRHKEAVVRQRNYRNIRLQSEDIAEFDYKPVACQSTYRMIVVRKNLSIERGEQALFDELRYFFYITNDRKMSPAEVVQEANQRCNQENLIEQLKNGVRALHAPVNTLLANWAYMIMASLAWSLKAWMALSLPTTRRWKRRDFAKRDHWLRMEFRKFLQQVICIPTQVVHTGRRIVIRLLSQRTETDAFFQLIRGLPSRSFTAAH